MKPRRYQMKKWLSLVAVVVLCLALVVGVACGGGGEDEEEVKGIKYGVGLPLSGIFGAAAGLPAVHASEVARELLPEFTVAGERYRFDTIFEDNMFTGAGGVATATKFIYEDGVTIMTQAGADPAGAAQTICEEAGVLMLTVASPPELFGPDKPHTIQTSPNYLTDTVVVLKYIAETYPEVKTIATAFADSALGHSVGDPIIDAAPYFGFDVVAAEWTPVGVTEYYPLATKLVNINPDIIFTDPLILSPLRELGYEGKNAYTNWTESWAEFVGWDNYQGAMIYQPNPYGEDMPPEARAFMEEIEQRFGDEPSQGSYLSGVMHSLLPQIMQKAGTVDDVDKILEVIHSGEYFDTWLGPMRFGGEELIGINNWLLWPGAVHEIRDHDYVLVYEMTADEAYELACEVYGDRYLK